MSTIEQVAEAFEHSLGEIALVSHWAGRTLTEANIGDADLRIALAREAIARAPAVAQVAVYDAQGKLIDAIRKPSAEVAPPAQDLPVADRETTGARWSVSDPGRSIPKYVERLGREGSPRGYLVSELDSRLLTSVLNSISQTRFDAPRGILLLDRNFRVVGGGDPEREPQGKVVQQKDVFAAAAIPADAFAVGFALTSEYQAPDGEDMVATVRTLPARGWAVIVHRPVRHAYVALATARRNLVAAAAMLSVLALVVGLWLGRTSTAPGSGSGRADPCLCGTPFRGAIHRGQRG